MATYDELLAEELQEGEEYRVCGIMYGRSPDSFLTLWN